MFCSHSQPCVGCRAKTSRYPIDCNGRMTATTNVSPSMATLEPNCKLLPGDTELSVVIKGAVPSCRSVNTTARPACGNEPKLELGAPTTMSSLVMATVVPKLAPEDTPGVNRSIREFVVKSQKKPLPMFPEIPGQP